MRAVAFEAMVLLPPLGRSAVPRARAPSCVGRFETLARHRRVLRSVSTSAVHLHVDARRLSREVEGIEALGLRETRLPNAPLHIAALAIDALIAHKVKTEHPEAIITYDSPSQFSRGYRRLFGAPPGQDREDSVDLMNLMRHELGFSKTENRFSAKRLGSS
jgi:hypothetical protein